LSFPKNTKTQKHKNETFFCQHRCFDNNNTCTKIIILFFPDDTISHTTHHTPLRLRRFHIFDLKSFGLVSHEG
jgi:hypothetical protein